jgi:Mg-chelatase subunit ChlD
MPDALKAAENIAAATGGRVYRSSGPANIAQLMADAVKKEAGGTIDVVICIDTTASMKNVIKQIREQFIAALNNSVNVKPGLRIGFVFFKDYQELYVTRPVAFTGDLAVVQKTLNKIEVSGGRDIPEAIYEALYDGAVKFDWQGKHRMIILVTDAPPHPTPRGKVKIGLDDALKAARLRNISINAVILPQKSKS